MRIEDIDRPRCKPVYTAALLEDLRWLGLDWDEGPDIGGVYSPYAQSERLERYEQALDKLMEEGYLYPCTCTRAQRQAIASAPHGIRSEGPVYPCMCRQQARSLPSFNGPYSLRFALPMQPISFRDALKGDQSFPAGTGGDFVVKRSDGIISYQLAVVIDDAAMAITDVLRGDDLLDSTPRQIALFRALKLPMPAYAHLPLLYGPDGRRLSKRHGSVTLRELRHRGVKPESITGYLAYWTGLLDRPEALLPRDLIASFRLSAISDQPVTIDAHQLNALIGS